MSRQYCRAYRAQRMTTSTLNTVGSSAPQAAESPRSHSSTELYSSEAAAASPADEAAAEAPEQTAPSRPVEWTTPAFAWSPSPSGYHTPTEIGESSPTTGAAGAVQSPTEADLPYQGNAPTTATQVMAMLVFECTPTCTRAVWAYESRSISCPPPTTSSIDPATWELLGTWASGQECPSPIGEPCPPPTTQGDFPMAMRNFHRMPPPADLDRPRQHTSKGGKGKGKGKGGKGGAAAPHD